LIPVIAVRGVWAASCEVRQNNSEKMETGQRGMPDIVSRNSAQTSRFYMIGAAAQSEMICEEFPEHTSLQPGIGGVGPRRLVACRAHIPKNH
jgi:hypothetical protein